MFKKRAKYLRLAYKQISVEVTSDTFYMLFVKKKYFNGFFPNFELKPNRSGYTYSKKDLSKNDIGLLLLGSKSAQN